MKLLPLILIACLLLAGVACTAAQPTSPAPMLGDINGNGRLDFGDVIALFQQLGGPYNPTGDMNANGRLDFLDVVLLWGRL